jgi:hypothetical protein
MLLDLRCPFDRLIATPFKTFSTKLIMMSSTTVGCYVFRQKAPNSRQKQRKIQASYVTRNSSRQKFDIDQLFLLAIPADFKESDPENWKLQAIRNLCSLHKYYAQYVHYAAFKTSKI